MSEQAWQDIAKKLITKWRDESREIQADYDARSRQVARAKGLHDCAAELAAALPLPPPSGAVSK